LHRRALITPDEVGRLFGDRSNPTALTLISGHQPLFMHRQFYYQLLDLAGFYDPHPDHPLPLTIVEANDARDRRARRMMEARRRADAEKQERERAADAKFQRELHEAVLRKRARDEREVLRLEAERQAKTRKRAARRFAVALAVLLVCALAAWWRL
jgi:hypothetical protein